MTETRRETEKNKAGYTATLVACGWAGAAKKKQSVTDGPTERRTERVVELRARDSKQHREKDREREKEQGQHL